jgi:hypothetical protein
MGLDLHTVEMNDGSSPTAQPDRLKCLLQFAVTTAAGAAAGDSVTTTISGVTLPAAYIVLVEVDQDATWYAASKTQTGFEVVTSPRLAANTLAGGTINIIVFG